MDKPGNRMFLQLIQFGKERGQKLELEGSDRFPVIQKEESAGPGD